MSASRRPGLPAAAARVKVWAPRNADASRRNDLAAAADAATAATLALENSRRLFSAGGAIVGRPFGETSCDGGEIVAHNASRWFDGRMIVEERRVSIDA